MSEGGDKTEEPSQKKLDDARKQGNVWKSKDLSSVLAFAVAMSVVRSIWPDFEARIKELFYFAIDHIAHPEEITLATMQLRYLALTAMLSLCIPVVFAAAVAGAERGLRPADLHPCRDSVLFPNRRTLPPR